jgi:hypothetical protein
MSDLGGQVARDFHADGDFADARGCPIHGRSPRMATRYRIPQIEPFSNVRAKRLPRCEYRINRLKSPVKIKLQTLLAEMPIRRARNESIYRPGRTATAHFTDIDWIEPNSQNRRR